MGQSAGANVWWAVLGFCVTGVGLPLLGIIAVGYSGCRDLREVASRVHPLYGLFYTVVCYMAIGPCFAIPRTGTVSFEIAVRPFLGADPSAFALPIFLAFFLGISCWLAASPSKLVDRIGKFLTPALLVTLAVMIVMSFATPMGDFQAPGKAYDEPIKAAFQGVLDGYNTLDAIAALVFATLIVNSVKEIGFTDPKAISSQVMKSGMLAGLLLALVYIFIAKIGAESVAAIGMQDTGAPVLAESAKVFFGSFGAYLLCRDCAACLHHHGGWPAHLLRSILYAADGQIHLCAVGHRFHGDFLPHRLVRFEDHHRFDHSCADVHLSALRGPDRFDLPSTSSLAAASACMPGRWALPL